MKVLIITLIDVETSLNQRTHHLIEFFARRGDEVTVLKRMAMREVDGIWRKFFTTARVRMKGNIRYVAIKPLIPLLIFRRTHAFAMAFSFCRWAKGRFDLCVTEAPFPGAVGVWLKRLHLAKVVVYEDLDYFEGFDLGNIKRLKETRRLERASLRYSDLIVSVGYELKRLRETQTCRKIVVVPNGVDYQLFNAAAAHPRPAEYFGLVYTGSLEEWAGIDLAIRAVPQLLKRIPSLRLYVIGKLMGESHYDEFLRQLAKDLGVEDHVFFPGQKDYAELPRFLAQAHVGLATFKPNDLMRYAFTLKVIEYMAAGLPVIATRIGETERVLAESGAGMVTDYTPEGLADAIRTMFESPGIMVSCAAKGVEYAKAYDWPRLFAEEMKAINKIRGVR